MRSTIIVLIAILVAPRTLEAEFTWSQAPSAPWSGRGDHTVTLFRDTLWLIGGWSGGLSKEIWCSPDGRDWNLVTDSAAWGGICGHTVTLHNNSLLLIGGLIDTVAQGDTGINSAIWRSLDGRHWTKVTDSAPFGKVWLHAAASHQGRIWILGGSRWRWGARPTNEVWYSTDGVGWSEVESIPWAKRRDHTANSFLDSLWVMGGEGGPGPYIWSSSDGEAWTGILPSPPWFCVDNTCNEFHRELWVMGGSYTNVVWRSEDGRNWAPCDSAPWPARSGHAAAVCRDTLWIFGGYGESNLLNDIWGLAKNPGAVDEGGLVPESVSPIPTVIRSSQLRLLQPEPIVLRDITGRRFVLKPSTSLNPGIYFIRSAKSNSFRKLVIAR